MEAGFGLLRLSPAHFWSMTPRELAAALAGLGAGLGLGAGQAPGRGDLDKLMQAFPDNRQTFPDNRL
ncbi:hypothetical protein NTH_03407 [Nitratireductor thuwali]|uniref:Phage tail assembly chaperone n=2 Tax=Nitratireductor thuwali TaxID=2267699 RepID=A0ABY5MP66_9HYPH|nr:hypothetical protein NTH_03407 [Nitratireductor thuwali]